MRVTSEDGHRSTSERSHFYTSGVLRRNPRGSSAPAEAVERFMSLRDGRVFSALTGTREGRVCYHGLHSFRPSPFFTRTCVVYRSIR